MPEDLISGLLIGFSLMLVLEGVIPFLYPQRWRGLAAKLASVSDSTLRWTGFLSMLLGTMLLYLVH
ncbi:MAG: DUF2065 domain-containing protein [Pontibacterium sp.]